MLTWVHKFHLWPSMIDFFLHHTKPKDFLDNCVNDNKTTWCCKIADILVNISLFRCKCTIWQQNKWTEYGYKCDNNIISFLDFQDSSTRQHMWQMNVFTLWYIWGIFDTHTLLYSFYFIYKISLYRALFTGQEQRWEGQFPFLQFSLHHSSIP